MKKNIKIQNKYDHFLIMRGYWSEVWLGRDIKDAARRWFNSRECVMNGEQGKFRLAKPENAPYLHLFILVDNKWLHYGNIRET
jgi:hypothetical protein